MKRAAEDDAGANKRKKKGDYVDDNDEEEDLLAVCFSHIEGVDDGHSQICWDLRNRLPPFNGNQEQFWARQPRVRHPLRESYNDSHLRLDPVNPLVTLRDHDRGAKRTIKQYAKSNFRVVKSTASITSKGLESHDVGLAKDYVECTGVYELVSALWQYAINLFLVRRDDYSGLVLLKVLHDVKFFQPVLMSKVLGKKQRDEKQVEVMKHFIDTAFERNSMLGKQGKPPLSYEELLRIARGAANLIYAGTGVGLDWGVDIGTCALDPYSLGDSNIGNNNNNNNSGNGSGGNNNGGNGGRNQKKNRNQGRGDGGSDRQRGGGPASGAGAPPPRGAPQWCRDWNNGACR